MEKEDVKTLELMYNTFVKMCDFIERNDDIGCRNCPCINECILKGMETEFLKFKPMVEKYKNSLNKS